VNDARSTHLIVRQTIDGTDLAALRAAFDRTTKP
jgi:hypothetical protein